MRAPNMRAWLLLLGRLALALALAHTAAASAPTTFTNPVLWEDLADNDVFRVNDTYYYTASSMHYSPGAPILRSYDLVNWEYIGHAVPSLSWAPKYSLANGQRAYVKGVFASSMRFRPATGLWYWIGCIEYATTYVYTAPAPQGPWALASTINQCLYDCGLLVDDDDTMYVAYGSTNLFVARLSPDGLRLASTTHVFASPVGALEGSRFYKRTGRYYIATDLPASAQHVLQAPAPLGPYTRKVLVDAMRPPVPAAGNPHQGSLVDTPAGAWYYMAFIDSYPGGRLPVLAPVTWGPDGFPAVTAVAGAWGASYPFPALSPPQQQQQQQSAIGPTTGTDTFAGTELGPAWEWNHNPDGTKFAVAGGALRLATATVTDDLYQARNTLTRRMHGPRGTGTAVLGLAGMADGDRAGLALLRDASAWVGVRRDGDATTVHVVTGLTMNADWSTRSTGTSAWSAALAAGVDTVWLRVAADIAPGGSHTATFAYSTDGTSFQTVGPVFTLATSWEFFMGYRYGIFNYATKALGGSVVVTSFTSA